jgi:hypothetical protein
MDLLIVAFFSPIVAGVTAVLVWAVAKALGLAKPTLAGLAVVSLIGGMVGAGITLGYTIVWMIWYQATTGFDPGNAPLGWLFFLGPLGFAAGELVGLIMWWFKRPWAVAQRLARVVGVSRVR